MKEILRSYKFALYPNTEQKILLDKHFGSVRYVYNYFLNARKEQYQASEKVDNYYLQAKLLTKLKNAEETEWLKDINSQSLQFSLRCLDTAYINFFRGTSSFPKFKSKKRKSSFNVPQNAQIVDNKIYIPKFKEGIKIIIHREIRGKISKCTFTKTPTGKYFVSILSKEQHIPQKHTGVICGIDLGLKNLLITSDGVKFKNNRYINKYEIELKKAQKHLSRKKNGSTSYEKQRRKVSKIYEKIVNSRKDNLHKITNTLIKNYDVICIEDLNITGMLKNHYLAKSISDVGWGTLIRFLEYKANWNEKKIIKIDRFYPSSKTCSVCGWINQNLRLSTRKWKCANGHVLDRDINASINILNEGLRSIGVELSDNTGGESISLLMKQDSVNPVAQML